MNVLRQLTSKFRSGDDSESELVEAAQRGDRRAFDALVRAYERQLRGFLLRRIGSCAADDVLQETWLASWVALPRYTGRSRFKAWLFAIALHKCTDYLRARGRAAAELPLEEADVRGVAQKDWYAAADTKQTVRALLVSLPVEQKEVVELYYYAELTLAEIAELLDRNLNTVKYQFYRAHTQIEQGLNASADAPPRPCPIRKKA